MLALWMLARGATRAMWCASNAARVGREITGMRVDSFYTQPMHQGNGFASVFGRAKSGGGTRYFRQFVEDEKEII